MANTDWRDDNDLKLVMSHLRTGYELQERLGRGGFARVYLIYHKILEKKCALKIMTSENIFNTFDMEIEDEERNRERYEELKKRFFVEAKSYAKIKHPKIVEIIDVAEVPDKTRRIKIPYLIMDYIEGETLKKQLIRGKKLEIKRVLQISGDILSALEKIHQKNIVHRDINPSNIMLKRETGEAVIIDFGLAKNIQSQTDLTRTGKVMGTISYMSPEQWKSFKDVDTRSDIYSFGVVLYEMLTGTLPFEYTNDMAVMMAHANKPVPDPRKINPGLPKGIENIIFKAMAKEPADRYRSAHELSRALENFKKRDDVSIVREEPLIAEKNRDNPPAISWLGKLKRPYLFTLLAVPIIAILVLLNPLGIGNNKNKLYSEYLGYVQQYITEGKVDQASEFLEKAREIKNTQEIEKLSKILEKKKELAFMIGDFLGLQVFIDSQASKEEKINRCREFLLDYKDIAQENGKVDVLERAKSTLDRLEMGSEEYALERYLEEARKHLATGNFKKARAAIAGAQEIEADAPGIRELLSLIDKKQEEQKKRGIEAKNGKTDYDGIKENINLSQYIAFEKNHPQSIFLEELKNKLVASDPNLPPQKHWTSITRNKQGYYERTFANGHIMIYLPGKNTWIDKYEVSIKQYKNFKSNMTGNDAHPVQVSYDNAIQYCREYNFELPTKEEWEYAAGAAKNYKYPWGNQKPDAGGLYRANYDTYTDREQDGYEQGAPVRSFANYCSPFGLVNMAGNAWEWVTGKILKGGGYLSLPEDLRIKSKSQGLEGGFRCIKKEIEQPGG